MPSRDFSGALEQPLVSLFETRTTRRSHSALSRFPQDFASNLGRAKPGKMSGV
jgi:hypothetical protein